MVALKICISLITLYFLSVTPLYLVAFRAIDKRPYFVYFILLNHIGTGPLNFWHCIKYKDFRTDVKLPLEKVRKINEWVYLENYNYMMKDSSRLGYYFSSSDICWFKKLLSKMLSNILYFTLNSWHIANRFAIEFTKRMWVFQNYGLRYLVFLEVVY